MHINDISAADVAQSMAETNRYKIEELEERLHKVEVVLNLMIEKDMQIYSILKEAVNERQQ